MNLIHQIKCWFNFYVSYLANYWLQKEPISENKTDTEDKGQSIIMKINSYN